MTPAAITWLYIAAMALFVAWLCRDPKGGADRTKG